MRLYTNKRGEWFGTQADAKRGGIEWEEVDFPTVKPDLLAWLNHYRVTNFEQPQGTGEGQGSTGTRKDPEPTTPTPQKIYPQGRPHPWTTIRECAEQASLKDLSVALAVFLNRYEEELS